MNLGSLNTLVSKYLGAFTRDARIRPERDWVIIVSITLVLLIGVGVWSYALYQKFTSLSSSTTTMTQPTHDALDTVQTIFQDRATRQAHYLTDYHFVDPSK